MHPRRSPPSAINTAAVPVRNDQNRSNQRNYPVQPGLMGLGIAGLFSDEGFLETPPTSARSYPAAGSSSPAVAGPSTGCGPLSDPGPFAEPCSSPAPAQFPRLNAEALPSSPMPSQPPAKKPCTARPASSAQVPSYLLHQGAQRFDSSSASAQSAEATISCMLPDYQETAPGSRQCLVAALARYEQDEQMRKMMLLTEICSGGGSQHSPAAALASLLMKVDAGVLLEAIDDQLSILRSLPLSLANRLDFVVVTLEPGDRGLKRLRDQEG